MLVRKIFCRTELQLFIAVYISR